MAIVWFENGPNEMRHACFKMTLGETVKRRHASGGPIRGTRVFVHVDRPGWKVCVVLFEYSPRQSIVAFNLDPADHHAKSLGRYSVVLPLKTWFAAKEQGSLDLFGLRWLR